MTEVSNNLLWFLQMLRHAEATLAHALAQSERFNKHDREVIDKIKNGSCNGRPNLVTIASSQGKIQSTNIVCD